VRRTLLVGEASDPETPDAPGMVVLGENWQTESFSPGVERWLTDLPDGAWHAGRLPSSVLAVAGRAARDVRGPADPAEVAVARVLTRSGTWVVLHGVPLAQTGPLRVAVIVEPAHPARIAPLLMAAYGLTAREQELTRLVLQGFSTAEIAERLVISVHTVQQHLKSVFDKTGVRSRRELVTKVFLAHYEPACGTTSVGWRQIIWCVASPSRPRSRQLPRSAPEVTRSGDRRLCQKAVGTCGPYGSSRVRISSAVRWTSSAATASER
jgi:DNA-binding CsgD family transcriptional regulator